MLACLLALGGAVLHADEPKSVDPQTVHRNAQELWRASIAAPRDGTPATDLGQAADAVQAIGAPPGRPKTAAPRVQTSPILAATTAPASGEPNAAVPATQPQFAGPPPIDANTLERLKLAPPSGPTGKVALADALFSQDQLDAAAVLYKEALAQDKAGRDKDWALFQIGNCLRSKDTPAARTFYKRVSAECPGSSWVVIAATECQYLDRQEGPTTRPAAAKGTGEARGAGARAIAAAPKVEANAR